MTALVWSVLTRPAVHVLARAWELLPRQARAHFL